MLSHVHKKKAGKVVRFLTQMFYISFLCLCLCGGVLHVWDMTEIQYNVQLKGHGQKKGTSQK